MSLTSLIIYICHIKNRGEKKLENVLGRGVLISGKGLGKNGFCFLIKLEKEKHYGILKLGVRGFQSDYCPVTTKRLQSVAIYRVLN